jgi:hypothetical protein
VASQSTLSRFFAGFGSAAGNLHCFRPLWQWCVHRLPSRAEGYTLDLDSTRLLHEDSQQEGVAVPCVVVAQLSQPIQRLLRGNMPPRERNWWENLGEKILSPFPNCNAVGNRPVFTS